MPLLEYESVGRDAEMRSLGTAKRRQGFMRTGLRNGLWVLALLLLSCVGPAGADTTFLNVCERGSAADVERALDGGADPNSRASNGMTALMMAAGRNSSPQVLSLLLKRGADVNAVANKGITALFLAAVMQRDPRHATLLLEAGADPNASVGITEEISPVSILIGAIIKNGEPAVVRALLKAGANPNAAVRMPIDLSKVESLKALKLKGDFAMSMTALMLAASTSSTSFNLEIVTELIRAGARVNAQNDMGLTALSCAALRSQSPAMVEVLLDAGADPRIEDQFGQTPLDYAKDVPALKRVLKRLSSR